MSDNHDKKNIPVAAEGNEQALSNSDDEYEAEITADGGVILTRYKGNAENVVIPAVWEGRPVVGLQGTFSNNDAIKSVTIPNSVICIGDGAFYVCRSLVSVTIPDSVTSIGNGAFDGCNSLTSVTIPDSVTYIGVCAFSDCPNITIECEENSYAQQYAKKATIPVRIVALEKKEKPKKREASDNIPFVSDEETPFVYCSYAHENADLVYPIMKRLHDDGFSIRYDEFDGKNSYVCSREINSCAYFLAFLTPEYVNGDCLEELRLASPDKRILYWLENCDLPQDLRLQQGCIQGLTSEYTYEDIITKIENQLIKGNCRGHYTPTIPGFDYKADDTGITLLKYTGHDEVVDIKPEYHGRPVIAIGNGTFSDCSSLTSVTIPDSVIIIGYMAFYGCSSLTSVTIPDSVIIIGFMAFYGCSSLTSITIPDSVTDIGVSAFFGCSSLTIVTIPDSVTSIGRWAFSGCSSLTSVTIPDSVTDIGDWVFYDCNNLTVLCPENSCAWQYCEKNDIPHKPLG